MPGFVLDKSLLSDTEQDDILAALQGFTAVGSGDSASVLNKLNVFFGKNAVPWLKVDFSDWGDSNRDLFDTLKSAILHRRVVMFDYYSAQGHNVNIENIYSSGFAEELIYGIMGCLR